VSVKKKGLGSGTGLGKRLEALGLTESHLDDDRKSALEIDVTDIVPNPRQARKVFHKEALQALADSISRYGIVQPVVVQKKENGKYELIAGERRWRAAQLCHLKTMPAIIKEYTVDVATEISLIENLQREDLDAIEEAMAYQMLIQEFELTQEQVSAKVGKSRSHVANMMRLLQLPQRIQEMLSDVRLTMGQARPLLMLKNETQQVNLAERIVREGLSARQVEILAKTIMEREGKEEKKPAEKDVYLESLQDKLKMYLGTGVSIHLNHKKNTGKIEISFTSEKEFERLLAMLTDEDQKREYTISDFSV
jgi:ParB family transcriptional regulator, chromosome partitioning protein